MTQDTYVRLIVGILQSYVPIKDSDKSALRGLARRHSDPLDVAQTMDAVRGLFGDAVPRQGYADIEKTLSRY